MSPTCRWLNIYLNQFVHSPYHWWQHSKARRSSVSKLKKSGFLCQYYVEGQICPGWIWFVARPTSNHPPFFKVIWSQFPESWQSESWSTKSIEILTQSFWEVTIYSTAASADSSSPCSRHSCYATFFLITVIKEYVVLICSYSKIFKKGERKRINCIFSPISKNFVS